jgi:hypothetical protein
MMIVMMMMMMMITIIICKSVKIEAVKKLCIEYYSIL